MSVPRIVLPVAEVPQANACHCFLCGGASRVDLNATKTMLSSRRLREVLMGHLGHDVFFHSNSLCMNCFDLVNHVDGLEVQWRLKATEIKTLYANTIKNRVTIIRIPDDADLVLEPVLDHPFPTEESTAKTANEMPATARYYSEEREHINVVVDHAQDAAEKSTPESICQNVPEGPIASEECAKKEQPVSKVRKIVSHPCDVCAKEFKHKRDLLNHSRVHSGEKPFQCTLCGKTFNQKQNLGSHMRTVHYKDRRYKCSECDDSFARRRLLECHFYSKHLKIRGFKCQYCPASYSYPEHRRKHVKINHANEYRTSQSKPSKA